MWRNQRNSFALIGGTTKLYDHSRQTPTPAYTGPNEHTWRISLVLYIGPWERISPGLHPREIQASYSVYHPLGPLIVSLHPLQPLKCRGRISEMYGGGVGLPPLPG